MWFSNRKEAANQELLDFVMENRGMRTDGYHKTWDSGYKKSYHQNDWDRSWPGRNAGMYINDFLHHGADINCRDAMGNTPLIYAASGREPDLAFALFRHYKADIEAKNNYGDTALTLAIITGHAGLAQELLLAGATTKYANVKGETPAALAEKSPSKEIQELAPYLKGEKPVSDIMALRKKQELDREIYRAAREGRVRDLKSAAEQGADINATNAKGHTPLMVAYTTEVVKMLVELGAKVDAQDADGKTALMYAAENDRADRVAELLKAGADLAITDKNGKTAAELTSHSGIMDLIDDEVLKRGGNTPALQAEREKKRSTRALFDALRNNDVFEIPALLKAGADAYGAYRGQNAMTYSINTQQQASTAVLIAAGVDLNKADAKGETPLFAAFKGNRWRTFEALLKYGAAPDVAGMDGENLLHSASVHNATAFAKQLSENKADITTPNKKGQSPVAAAVYAGSRAEIIDALAKAGANLNEPDAEGNTLLMQSLRHNRDQTSWALVQGGADVTLKNAKGESALDICAKFGTGGLYNEIKKREDAARDKRIADLEEQVKQLGGDITKPPAAPAAVTPAAKPSSPGTP
ncbi:MAG: ankyrin repeat domain-containing protein [Alphaproteobacteria bacterium]